MITAAAVLDRNTLMALPLRPQIRQWVTVGSTPYEESYATVRMPDYAYRARQECARFIRQLRKINGVEPIGARLFVKGFPLDNFGTYYEVACEYDPENKKALWYAFNVADNLPARWDAEVQ